MARTRSSTDGTPKDVRDRTIEEMRAQFHKDEYQRKENFDKAMEALKRFRDPNKVSDVILNNYDRKRIRDYLKRPAKNEDKLREVAQYLISIVQILCNFS